MPMLGGRGKKQLLWNSSMYNSTPGARYGQRSLCWGFRSRHTHGRYVTNNLEAFLMVADYRPVCGDTRLWLACCADRTWGQEASRMADSILSFFIRKRPHMDPFGTLPRDAQKRTKRNYLQTTYGHCTWLSFAPIARRVGTESRATRGPCRWVSLA